MKSIVAVNKLIPTAEKFVGYFSGESLSDYDIAIFGPSIPYLDRVHFDGGGSCLTVDSTARLTNAMSHWGSEFKAALNAGKTIFIVMDEYVTDLGATGSTLVKNSRTYSTFHLNNYQFIPSKLNVKNAKGQKIVVSNNNYRALYESIKDTVHYRVVINSVLSEKAYTTKDGAPVGGVIRFADRPGSIVLLPFFDFDDPVYTKQEGKAWNAIALKTSKALVSQLVAIDKLVRGSIERSPPPDWVADFETPALLTTIEKSIADLDRQIARLQQQRSQQAEAKADVLDHSHLLFETGRNLELAIEKALIVLGYRAETLRIGDLEIDHVIVGPSGKRMIGESEGKDSSAIDITKFRQLESNIAEDFQREEISEPAKGLLFGNGFRLMPPKERAEQFTQKSLINAKRLGSGLIRTADLYPVVTYLLDHPDDEAFKLACRTAIETTDGGIVEFPSPT